MDALATGSSRPLGFFVMTNMPRMRAAAWKRAAENVLSKNVFDGGKQENRPEPGNKQLRFDAILTKCGRQTCYNSKAKTTGESNQLGINSPKLSRRALGMRLLHGCAL